MVNRGMFVYPWDVGADTSEFIRRYADLGCNMMAINAVYHQCNVLDMSLRHVYERRNAGVSFAIHPEKYGRIQPRVEAELTKTYQELREQCEKHNIDWRCWMVNLHNGQIGERYPDTTVLNVWGDRYPSALCVNHPDIRSYAHSVLTDVLDTLAPSRVIMETEGWMQAFHGRHHEFSLARLTSAVRYLLSLCFCPHCIAAAAAYGVDAVEVKRICGALLEQLLDGDTTFDKSEDTQLLQIFLEYPQLYAYQQFRARSVNTLIEEAASIAHARGALYECIPSAAPFEINAMHFEGTSFGALADTVDGFVPLCYSPNETYPLIKRNIRLFAPDTRVSLALSLNRSRNPGAAEWMNRVREAVEDGAEDVYCYNYGLATRECLGWMRQAYRSIQTGKG